MLDSLRFVKLRLGTAGQVAVRPQRSPAAAAICQDEERGLSPPHGLEDRPRHRIRPFQKNKCLRNQWFARESQGVLG